MYQALAMPPPTARTANTKMLMRAVVSALKRAPAQSSVASRPRLGAPLAGLAARRRLRLARFRGRRGGRLAGGALLAADAATHVLRQAPQNLARLISHDA